MPALPEAKERFQFVTRLVLTELTPWTATNLSELAESLRLVPENVIYHHTHRYLEQHHFLSPEPPNDFAYWVSEVIKEPELAERLAGVNTIQFSSLALLRQKLIGIIEEHLQKEGPGRTVRAGEAFRFMKSILFVLPTPYSAGNLKEFAKCLRQIPIHSLYHHIFDARLRVPGGQNDFSRWLETNLEEPKLAKAIPQLDPYTQTLDRLRKRMVELVEKRIREFGS